MQCRQRLGGLLKYFVEKNHRSPEIEVHIRLASEAGAGALRTEAPGASNPSRIAREPRIKYTVPDPGVAQGNF